MQLVYCQVVNVEHTEDMVATNRGDEEEPEEQLTKKDASKVTLSGRELIVLVIYAPVVFVWLFLAARIVISATTSSSTLENIEGL